MSKHTEGPWRAAPAGRVVAQDGEWWLQVCKVGAFDDPDMLVHCKSRWEADANLIAAAPEMLEALEKMVAAEHRMPGYHPNWMRYIRAIVAKAKGESE